MESEIENQNSEDSSVRLAITTFPSDDVARQIGTVLVGSQLVACINILPNVTSIYHWEGKMEVESEVIAFMKTSRNQVSALKQKLTEIHPYDVPELLIIRVSDGMPSYLDWVKNYCAR